MENAYHNLFSLHLGAENPKHKIEEYYFIKNHIK